jgi:hypothetical protein
MRMVPSTICFTVVKLAELLAVVSDGPITNPGLMTTRSQRSCSPAISHAARSASTLE